MTLRPRAALALVLAVALAYPLVTLAGGLPRFPTRDECAREATAETDSVQVVYGRFDGPDEAEALLEELLRAGREGTIVEVDACGRWKVAYEGLESYAQAQALADEVRRSGFDARVEVGD